MENIIQNKVDLDHQGLLHTLKSIADQFSNSLQLLELGAKDSISSRVEDIKRNPVKYIFDNYYNAENHISGMIEDIIYKLLQHHKELINNAFRTNESVTLFHYSLILKEDTDENRLPFIDFLNEYQMLPFSERFNIVFQFVPQELMGKLNIYHTIKL